MERPTLRLAPGQLVPTLLQTVEYKKKMEAWELEQKRLAQETYMNASRLAAEALMKEVGAKIVTVLTENHRTPSVSLTWPHDTPYEGRRLAAFLNHNQYCPGVPEERTLLEMFKKLLAETEYRYSVNNSGTSLHVTVDLNPAGL